MNQPTSACFFFNFNYLQIDFVNQTDLHKFTEANSTAYKATDVTTACPAPWGTDSSHDWAQIAHNFGQRICITMALYMKDMVSAIADNSSICSTACSGQQQRKHQSSVLAAIGKPRVSGFP